MNSTVKHFILSYEKELSLKSFQKKKTNLKKASKEIIVFFNLFFLTYVKLSL